MDMKGLRTCLCLSTEYRIYTACRAACMAGILMSVCKSVSPTSSLSLSPMPLPYLSISRPPPTPSLSLTLIFLGCVHFLGLVLVRAHVQLLAFFLNAYNLMVLHAHVVRGSLDGSDFKSQKIPFTRDNQYMIAAYNYSLGTPPPIAHTTYTIARTQSIHSGRLQLLARFPRQPPTHAHKQRESDARLHAYVAREMLLRSFSEFVRCFSNFY